MATRSSPFTMLWTCPKCGARLVTRNMAHSCGRATLAEWHSRMGPRARALFDRFEQLVAACGEYHLAPAKTRIAFMALVRFANITRLDETTMHCNFALPTPLRSPRLHKVEEIIPGWWVHHLRVAEAAALDRQVQGWIRRSYQLMGMRKRLRVPPGARFSRAIRARRDRRGEARLAQHRESR